jgi:hypothetical protein
MVLGFAQLPLNNNQVRFEGGTFTATPVSAVPEPSALEGLLLGTGLLGLAEMARRKLQLGT